MKPPSKRIPGKDHEQEHGNKDTHDFSFNTETVDGNIDVKNGENNKQVVALKRDPSLKVLYVTILALLVAVASLVVSSTHAYSHDSIETSSGVCEDVGTTRVYTVCGYLSGFRVLTGDTEECSDAGPANPTIEVNLCDMVQISYRSMDNLLHDFVLSDNNPNDGTDLGFINGDPVKKCGQRHWNNMVCSEILAEDDAAHVFTFQASISGSFTYFCSVAGHFLSMNGVFSVGTATSANFPIYLTLPEDIVFPEANPDGLGKNVIRRPRDCPPAINIDYTPLTDENGTVIYYQTLDSEGNLVAKPKCQNSFDSTWEMKGNSFVFGDDCPNPLPARLTEVDIRQFPRRNEPKVHHIYLETLQIVAELEPGVTFEWWTYNGTVPGPPLRVRVGDWIDLTLVNPTHSSMEHTVDFHAITGPGGGATTLRVDPGESARGVFQMLYPGMFIYHCASHPIAEHISRGMYGAIIVEPEQGLPYSDVDLYLAQGELYLRYPLVNEVTDLSNPKTGPGIKTYNNEFDTVKEKYELMDAVFFNGSPFGLVRDPVVVGLGEVIRIFMVTGGPNVLSSFHVIGDHFDRVWLHADLSTPPQQNVQTTPVLPGSCTVADMRMDVAGNFILVDHALTRTFRKGSLGFIRVCEQTDSDCFAGVNGEYGKAGVYGCGAEAGVFEGSPPPGNDWCVSCSWDRWETTSDHSAGGSDVLYNFLYPHCPDLNYQIIYQRLYG